MFLGVPSLTKKSPPSPIFPFPQPFQVTRSPKYHFSSILQNSGMWKKFYKLPLTTAEEKHVDTYMVISTTKNKPRTKYSKEVSKKRRSQFLITFDKVDFFMIQRVIEYLLKRDNLRLESKYIYIYIYVYIYIYIYTYMNWLP